MRGLRARSSDILSTVVKNSFEKRVLVLKAGRNTVRFLPPLTIFKEEMDEGIKRFRSALDEI